MTSAASTRGMTVQVSGLVAALAAAVTGSGWAVASAVACVLAMAALNFDFYRLCGRRRGPAFALAACGLHWLFFVYSSLTFGAVVLRSRLFAAASGLTSRT